MIVTFKKQDPFQPIVELHRAGKFAEAEAGYHQVLTQEPNHADALHMLGLLYHQTGRSAQGIGFIQKSIAVLPTNPMAFSNLAELVRSVGQFAEAERLCRQSLALMPN